MRAAYPLAGQLGGVLDESFHRPVLAQPCGERRGVKLALLACARRRRVDDGPIAGAAIERKHAVWRRLKAGLRIENSIKDARRIIAKDHDAPQADNRLGLIPVEGSACWNATPSHDRVSTQ
jgi:hypothetical protein